MFDESSSLHGLDGLSNDELLTNTQRLVGCGNQLLAALLAHLGEVEARGVHRERSCPSLYSYCVYVLRMPEDTALRRAKAARIVRQFPATLAAIARGELHLTGLLLLGPHLTEANLVEVLALAKHRKKKEIEKLVRRLDPLPDVPPRIEPLGPPRAGFVTNFAPTWNAMAEALAGPVRDLPPGERPGDWMVDPSECASGPNGKAAATTSTTSTMADEPPTPQRYQVQFTADQEYVDLFEEARDLLSHAAPNARLDEVHRRALQALVRELRKKKYGETDRPRDARVHETSGKRSGLPTRASRRVPHGTFPLGCGIASPSATSTGARLWTRAGSAAAKLGCSSFITFKRTQTVVCQQRRTSRSDVELTTRSPPRRTSVASTFAKNEAFPTRASAASSTSDPACGADDPSGPARAARSTSELNGAGPAPARRSRPASRCVEMIVQPSAANSTSESVCGAQDRSAPAPARRTRHAS